MKDKIEYLADTYGYESQSLQLVEEMAELTQALNHLRRYKDYNEFEHRQSVFEEMADVEVMLDQMKYLLNCHAEVEEYKRYKVDRQIKRLQDGDY